MSKKPPILDDYDSYEEYEEALDAFNDYEDWAYDKWRDEKD